MEVLKMFPIWKKEARMTLQPSLNHNNHSHTGIGNTRTYARRAQHSTDTS